MWTKAMEHFLCVPYDLQKLKRVGISRNFQTFTRSWCCHKDKIFVYSGLPRSMPNGDQCRPMPDEVELIWHWLAWIGIDQYWSALIGNDWHWSALTSLKIDRHWSAFWEAFWINAIILIGIDRHWSALIGIDRHWSALGIDWGSPVYLICWYVFCEKKLPLRSSTLKINSFSCG